MPNLQDYPLPIAIMVAAFWVIQQNNAAFAKQLVALIDTFSKEYEALIKDYQVLLQRVSEDRNESRERWVERDRQLVAIAQETKEAQVRNAEETHKLRGMITPLVLSVEADRRRSKDSSRNDPKSAREGGEPHATE